MWSAAITAVGFGLFGATPPTSVFTVAGEESSATSICWPLSRCPAATEQRLTGRCLTTLADGTILLCERGGLRAVGADGRVREWAEPSVGDIWDADAAPDGSVVVIGGRGVQRVLRTGVPQMLVSEDIQDLDVSIAATEDGGAVMTTLHGAARVRADGKVTPLPLDGQDVARLPDGAVAVAQSSERRVVRIGADGRVSVLAGGGRGIREGAPATSVGLPELSSVSAAPDGTLLIGSERGVLRVGHDGRIRTVVAGEAPGKFIAFNDPRAADADGLHAGTARVRDIVKVHALDAARALVLTVVPGPDEPEHLRVALIAGSTARLAVALPGANRTLLRQGRAEIVSTRRAVARVQVRRGSRVVASRRVAVAAGRTRIRLKVPASDAVHIIRVEARARDGAIATHRLTFIPGVTLSSTVARRVGNMVSVVGITGYSDMWVVCRRRTARVFGCRSEESEEDDGTYTARAVLHLRDDGLISYRETQAERAPKLRFVFEPLTYDVDK